MRGCAYVCGYEKKKNQNPVMNREGILIYGRTIFKYTEIVCRKPHDVSTTVHMDSKLYEITKKQGNQFSLTQT